MEAHTQDMPNKQFPVLLMNMRTFRKHLFRFCEDIVGNRNEVVKLFADLKPLFGSMHRCQKLSSCLPMLVKKEMHVAFWAFTKSSQQHIALINFLVKLCFPRLHMSAETKPSHLEGFFCLTPSIFYFTFEDFENWFERFLDTLHMSAGVTTIDVYMGPQMLTCMDRIENGNTLSLKHNLHTHKDFLTLYRFKLSMRDEAAKVALQTQGMEFSANNMISLYQQNMRLNRSLRNYNTRERRNWEALQEYNNAVNYQHNPRQADRMNIGTTDSSSANERVSGEGVTSEHVNHPALFFGDRNVLRRLQLAFMPNAIPFEPD